MGNKEKKKRRDGHRYGEKREKMRSNSGQAHIQNQAEGDGS